MGQGAPSGNVAAFLLALQDYEYLVLTAALHDLLLL
jgi:hypothetical protein